MDFMKMYGLPIWMLIALVCLALGAYFTTHRKQAREVQAVSPGRYPLPRQKMRALSFPALPHAPQRRALSFCPSCGKQNDTPDADSCSFCGHTHVRGNAVHHNKRRGRSRWCTGTHLVDTTGL